MDEKKTVLMYSGGLDSLIAYYYLKETEGKPPITVYSNIGHRYAEKEIVAITKINGLTHGELDPVIDVTLELGQWEQVDANIPMRNMFLLMVGSYYGNEVHLVCQKGEQDLPDRSPKFFHSANGMLSLLHGKKVSTYATFPDNTKTDMVRWYKKHGYDLDVLKASVSCYSPSEGMCGCCSSCFRRWVAMSLNDIHEQYNSNPWEWSGVKGYIDRIKTGQIDPSRVEDIKMALEMKGVKF